MILKAMDDMGLKNPYVWQCQIPDSTLSEGKDKMVWFVTGTQLMCNYKGKHMVGTNWIHFDLQAKF